MKRIAKTCTAALAALVCGCQTTAEAPDAQPWPIGHWKGSNRFRTQIETRIEAVQDDRHVLGTACWSETSGVLSGQRLDDVARLSETGSSMRFDIGQGIFHMQHSGDGKTTLWETRVRNDTTLTRALRTRFNRTRTPRCTPRFRAQPQTPALVPTTPTEPMRGHWSAQNADGMIAEMSITKATRNELEAMYCTRGETGEIRIFDLVRRGPLKPRLDADQRTLTFEERLRRGKNRYSFVLQSEDEAQIIITREARRKASTSSTLTMRRGAARSDGCIARTTTSGELL